MKLLNITNEQIPPIDSVRDHFKQLIQAIPDGKCAEFSPFDLDADRRQLLKAAKLIGAKITTRKTDKGTLKVWRMK